MEIAVLTLKVVTEPNQHLCKKNVLGCGTGVWRLLVVNERTVTIIVFREDTYKSRFTMANESLALS